MIGIIQALFDLIFISDRAERERRAEERKRTQASRDALLREFERADRDGDGRADKPPVDPRAN